MDAGLVALAAEVLTCPGMCVATRVRSLLTLRNVVWCASGRRTAGRNKVLVAKLVAIMKDTDDAVNDAIDSDAEDGNNGAPLYVLGSFGQGGSPASHRTGTFGSFGSRNGTPAATPRTPHAAHPTSSWRRRALPLSWFYADGKTDADLRRILRFDAARVVCMIAREDAAVPALIECDAMSGLIEISRAAPAAAAAQAAPAKATSPRKRKKKHKKGSKGSVQSKGEAKAADSPVEPNAMLGRACYRALCQISTAAMPIADSAAEAAEAGASKPGEHVDAHTVSALIAGIESEAAMREAQALHNTLVPECVSAQCSCLYRVVSNDRCGVAESQARRTTSR